MAFKPTYDADGKQVEYIYGVGSYYGQYIDKHLTLYREHGSDKIIGWVVDLPDAVLNSIKETPDAIPIR
jgi:hypothetical protein